MMIFKNFQYQPLTISHYLSNYLTNIWMLIDINHYFPMISWSPSFFTLARCKDGVRCSNSPSTNDGSNHVQYLILGQQINMPLNMFKLPQSTWIGRDSFFFHYLNLYHLYLTIQLFGFPGFPMFPG